ncbi:hypothetical protein EZV62_027121 [Acer yangbiense]|uniref:Uncharacterized protein n=1 Tax=Acer yangbiense TaxID=1000413 RepID=A0A5C7GTL2_9ROSI|nr:hypothetical protein EZV62_027121 [Acer yangbiense]
MGEAQELQLHIMVEETKEANSAQDKKNTNQSTLLSQHNPYKWWLRTAVYTMFVVVGQSVAVILGRFYYMKGGKCKWMQLTWPKHSSIRLSDFTWGAIPFCIYRDSHFCFAIGLQCFLLFSPQPAEIHSTDHQLSSPSHYLHILLMFNNDSANSSGVVSKVKYAIGFVCMVVGAAVGGLVLALTQLAFCEVLKRGKFKENKDLIICQSIVATSATLAAITSQLIGVIGLIFEVSSLFCNAIVVLSLPVVSVLSVTVFHDKMDKVKVISMVLAIWGTVSYVYQQYLDERKSKTDTSITNE